MSIIVDTALHVLTARHVECMMPNSFPNESKIYFGVLGLLNYDLRTQIEDPDAVISWEISLSLELLFFKFFLLTASDPCLSIVRKSALSTIALSIPPLMPIVYLFNSCTLPIYLKFSP